MSIIPKVLFLHGVRKLDLCSKAQKKLTTFEEVRNKVVYANTPSRVIYRSDLARVISSRCWHCDIKFTGIEIFFPKVIEENKFLAEGTFNSFKCLLSYVQLNYQKSQDEIESINKVDYLWNILKSHFPESSLEPAPSKYIMDKYGGGLKEEDYKVLL